MAIPVLAAGVRVASVSNISLVQHCPQLILGAAGEWPARWKDKIAQVYGCTFRQILQHRRRRPGDCGGVAQRSG